MKNTENDEKNHQQLFLPCDIPEIHATGAAVAVSPFNIRLLLINEEIDKNDDFVESNIINTFNSATGEIILHPLVAKRISDLLAKNVKKYESKYGKLPEG